MFHTFSRPASCLAGLIFVILGGHSFADPPPGNPLPSIAAAAAAAPDSAPRRTLEIAGWTIHVSAGFRGAEAETQAVEAMLPLLTLQLQEIIRLVPAPALAELQKVPLWISPPYPGRATVAEYHPAADWLRENGRDPAMARSVEFSNISRYAQESRRMPLLVLHELAHAWHDRVAGFAQPEILAAYRRAKDAGIYESVERRSGVPGQPSTRERAYALTDEKEYFAECTEAFFGVNDFFPFTRTDLQRHDPAMFELVQKLWNAPAERPTRKSS